MAECLQLVDSNPKSDGVNFPLNGTITLTFSDDILESSLNQRNFKVWTNNFTRRYDLSISYYQDDSGNVDHSKISIKPSALLDPNESYVIVILGNINTNDNRNNGVTSKNNLTLPENICIFFDTGTTTVEIEDNCGVGAVVFETFDKVEPDSVEVGGELQKPLVITDPEKIACVTDPCDDSDENKPELRITSTCPENGEINVCFRTLQINFSDEIDWDYYGIEVVPEDGSISDEEIDTRLEAVRKALARILRVERHDIPFDLSPEGIAAENASYIATAKVQTLSPKSIIVLFESPFLDEYTPNSEYTIVVKNGSLKGLNTTSIDKTTVKFLTFLSPSYASIDQIEARMPDQFDLSEYDIYRLIAEYSEMLVMRYGGRVINDPQFAYLANRFIICSLLNDLMSTYRDSIGGLRMRQQFGLMVAYNAGKVGEGGGPYDQCLQDALNGLDSLMGENISIGVKSGNTAWYTSRRRGIRSQYTYNQNAGPGIYPNEIVPTNVKGAPYGQ